MICLNSVSGKLIHEVVLCVFSLDSLESQDSYVLNEIMQTALPPSHLPL